jgi:NAD(P)H-hydrate epimerase
MVKGKLYIAPKDSHKGQNGKLLVIGGSRAYHGAPVFSLLAARRFVDLMYFYPGEEDPPLIMAVKRIPEAIVVHDLERLPYMDCALFGIGLSDAMFDAESIIPTRIGSWKLVIDGDGLERIKEGPGIPPDCILTPHEGEFRMLFGLEGNTQNVRSMAAKYSCVILKKGAPDIIADGRSGEARNTKLEINRVHNQGMTKGGTGDVLAGLVAALSCKNDIFTAAVAGTRINGYAGNLLMKKSGYNFCASDLADSLAQSYAKLYGK